MRHVAEHPAPVVGIAVVGGREQPQIGRPAQDAADDITALGVNVDIYYEESDAQDDGDVVSSDPAEGQEQSGTVEEEIEADAVLMAVGRIPNTDRLHVDAAGLDLTEGGVLAVDEHQRVLRGGEPVKMSKRAGEFVTLRQLRAEVGNDACRFFYVLRKCDQHLDFDLDLATKQSNENPVYYIQYAHARINSVLNQSAELLDQVPQADITPLTAPTEIALLQRLQRDGWMPGQPLPPRENAIPHD